MYKLITAIIKQLLIIITVLFVIFIMLTLTPVDPYQDWTDDMIKMFGGANLSPFEHFIFWLEGVLQLDLKMSIVYQGLPVLNILLDRFTVTLSIVLGALFASLSVCIPLAYVSVFSKHKTYFRCTKSIIEWFSSIPVFIIALGCIIFLLDSFELNWVLRHHFTLTDNILFYSCIFFMLGLSNGVALELIRFLIFEFTKLKNQSYMIAVKARFCKLLQTPFS